MVYSARYADSIYRSCSVILFLKKKSLNHYERRKNNAINTYSLTIDGEILEWDEGIPLGNGSTGALLWNSGGALRFSVDRNDIWDCSNAPEEDENFKYSRLYEWVKKGKQRKIVKTFDKCYDRATPTKLPAGKIIMNISGDAQRTDFKLDFKRAEVTVRIGDATVRSFIHAKKDFGVIYTDKKGVGFRVENPEFGVKGKFEFRGLSGGITQSLKRLKYEPPVKRVIEGDVSWHYFTQKIGDATYGLALAVRETDEGTLALYKAGVSSSNDFFEEIKAVLSKEIALSYDELIAEHIVWWDNYNKLSALSLPDKKLERYWNYTNYLLASCSRKGGYPMALQGVWCADNGSLPPWKGDYHHDLNTEMCYSSYIKANRVEEGEAFIDYILSLEEVGERFADNFYGKAGVCLPAVMDIRGHALGGWSQYALSPVNTLWLAAIMVKHYDYTGDEIYLKDRLYPYLAKVGEFLFDILNVEDVVYRLPLSTSPEIHDNTLRAWLEPNSNYDLALMRKFTEDMARISDMAEGTASGDIWRERLTKFEALAVDERGVLRIDKTSSLTESHRHLSHCMAIFPLRTMPYNAENKRVIDATIADIERLGEKHWVGYTYAWLANLYTVQGRGDKAYGQISCFIDNFCTKNLFHVNGDYRNATDCGIKYRYFTLEGNFLIAEAINNMLLYSEEDGINLFPAVPSEWSNAEFSNLRGFGGITVSARLEKGKVAEFSVAASRDIAINVCGRGMEKSVSLSIKRGERVRIAL